ncbi:HAD-IA family hydrolase [Zooshikella harenae]|uniref:HAD-IA family hydrolase n=1 Tax=Zooshikella harenae TaxID=2827238 RepID=A0ABS5ZEH1_9GAMM|nr:HAD-IA family hydrolase [Zooshikella harenae]MBU2712385.1 HAD-IA family hydrolase [Zooshikella harenae]
MYLQPYFRHPQAISFDLDDTLYDNGPVIDTAEVVLMDWIRNQCPKGDAHNVSYWAAYKRQVQAVQPELEHDVTQWRYETLKAGFEALSFNTKQSARFATDGVDLFLVERNKANVPVETKASLAKLSACFPLVVITNGNADVEKIGLKPFFTHVLSAGIDGRAKPYGDLFLRAQTLLNIDSQYILHVGDHWQADIIGANQAGFQSCWLNMHQQQQADTLHKPTVEISHLSELVDLLIHQQRDATL